MAAEAGRLATRLVAAMPPRASIHAARDASLRVVVFMLTFHLFMLCVCVDVFVYNYNGYARNVKRF